MSACIGQDLQVDHHMGMVFETRPAPRTAWNRPAAQPHRCRPSPPSGCASRCRAPIPDTRPASACRLLPSCATCVWRRAATKSRMQAWRLQLGQPALGIQTVAIAEHALKHLARIDGDRQGRGRARPGQGVGIGAAIAAVAAAHQAGRLKPQFQRRDLGLVAELLGHQLIHRHAAGDVGAFGLLDMDAGQIAAAAAAMVARAIAQSFGLDMGEAGEHRDLVAIGLPAA